MEKILPHFQSFPLALFPGKLKFPLGKFLFYLTLSRSDRERKTKWFEWERKTCQYSRKRKLFRAQCNPWQRLWQLCNFTDVEMKSVRGSTACLKLYCFSKISKAINQEFPSERDKPGIEKKIHRFLISRAGFISWFHTY